MATPEEAGFRVDPPLVADERRMLDAWLDYHRGTLLWKCDGLSPTELVRRSVEPATLTLLGLVRHMAQVEQGWFRGCLAAETYEPLYSREDAPDADFDEVDQERADADLATYRAEVDRCRAVAARFDLDDCGERRGTAVSLRWIYLHMIEEYARHNGHADLLRERIDGATGD